MCIPMRTVCIPLVISVCLSGPAFLQTATAEEPLPKTIVFNRDIRPIFAANCFGCHGPDGKKRQAGSKPIDCCLPIKLSRPVSVLGRK